MACVKHGDALRVARPDCTLDTHVWFVMSDPSQNPDVVLLLNMTSYGDGRGKDGACILERGEREWIIKKSCIEFGRARNATADGLHTLCFSHQIENLGFIGAPLLEKLLKACGRDGNDLPNKYRALLAAQGLIDL